MTGRLGKQQKLLETIDPSRPFFSGFLGRYRRFCTSRHLLHASHGLAIDREVECSPYEQKYTRQIGQTTWPMIDDLECLLLARRRQDIYRFSRGQSPVSYGGITTVASPSITMWTRFQ